MVELIDFVGKLEDFGFLFLQFFGELGDGLLILVIKFFGVLVILGNEFLQVDLKVFYLELFLLDFFVFLLVGLNDLKFLVLLIIKCLLGFLYRLKVLFDLCSQMVDVEQIGLVFYSELILFHFEFADNVLELKDFFALNDFILDDGLLFLD